MNIEFHAPDGQVKEWIIEYAKEQLVQLYRQDREISRAQVYFKPWTEGENVYKVCEIDLTIYKHSLFVHRKGNNYGKAMRKAVSALYRKVEEHLAAEIASTGNVYFRSSI